MTYCLRCSKFELLHTYVFLLQTNVHIHMYIYVYIESYFVGILNYSLSRGWKGKEGGKEGEEGSVARNSKF